MYGSINRGDSYHPFLATKKGHQRNSKAAYVYVLEIANEAGDVKEEDLPYLFERFYIADRIRSGEGTGVGLAVVKKLMEMMSGEASVILKNGRLRFILKWQLAK